VAEAAPAVRPGRHAFLLIGAGILLLALLWLGPLAGAGRRSFTAHMTLHIAVVAVAAPLIAFGLLEALAGRRRLRAPLLVGLGASFLEMGVVWAWHAPALHEAAALDGGAFALQQASFLVAAIALWLVSFADRSVAASAVGLFAMLLTFMHMTMLGTGLALSQDLVYSPIVCRGVFGLGPLDDQQLGGVLMASVGAVPFLGGGIVLAARLIGRVGA
jgi:putative membrane protein